MYSDGDATTATPRRRKNSDTLNFNDNNIDKNRDEANNCEHGIKVEARNYNDNG